MKFQREPASKDLFDEISPLLHQHWQEISHYPDISLAPDWDAYLAADQAGLLRIFTVRTPNTGRLNLPGDLVGYAVFFVRPHPHYKGHIFAVQDILYVEPQRRHGGLGAKLILFCDNELRAEGVHVVTQHAKAAHDFGKMLGAMGYELMDKIYVKRLN